MDSDWGNNIENGPYFRNSLISGEEGNQTDCEDGREDPVAQTRISNAFKGCNKAVAIVFENRLLDIKAVLNNLEAYSGNHSKKQAGF